MIVADGHYFFSRYAAQRRPFRERRSFRASGMDYVNHRKVFALIRSHSEPIFFRESPPAQSCLRVSHRRDLPGEHHLNRILGKAGFPKDLPVR